MLGLNWPELLVIALVGFFVFGPERLPGKAREAAQMVRKLREMAQSATDDLRSQLPEGSELGLTDLRDLRDLHPRRIMSRALFEDDQPPAVPAEPLPVGTAALTTAPGAVPPFDVDAT